MMIPTPGDDIRVCDDGDAIATGALVEIHDLGRGHWLLLVADYWAEVDVLERQPSPSVTWDAVVA